MRRAGWTVGLLAAALALAVLLWPRGHHAIIVLGDGRDALAEALGPAGGPIRLRAVLLRRPEALRHLPDVAALCRGACDAAATLILEPRPGGPRKTLVVALDRFPGAAVLDAGGRLPPALATCLARAARAEAEQVRPATLPDCVPDRNVVLRLPFGL
jgi:hypothetical protein